MNVETPPTDEDWLDPGYQPRDDINSLDWQCWVCGASASSLCRADDPDTCPNQPQDRAETPVYFPSPDEIRPSKRASVSGSSASSRASPRRNRWPDTVPR